MTSPFQKITRDLFAAEKNSAQILKDHPQIPLVIDILSRKENHHIQLKGISSEKINLAFLESIAWHLSEGSAPKSLRDIDFIYFDNKFLDENSLATLSQDFAEFSEELRASDRKIIFVTYYFEEFLQSVLSDSRWRVIILDQDETHQGFHAVKLAQPSESEFIAMLKTYKYELENFHHVLIPEETFASAFSMAAHYLTSVSSFDTSLELLDSASARASSIDNIDPAVQFKPMVTSTTLAHVVSSWTQIPLSHLHNNTFQAKKFIEALQRRVYGQESAVSLIGSVLQHGYLKLHEKTGPLCSFLFVGAIESGKTTAAITMAEHLFGHKNALLKVNLNESCHSISEIKVISEENEGKTLLAAIKQTPYAIVLIENIHQAPATVFNLFKNIFTHGFAIDEQGNKYNFNHAIMVITTTLGSDRIAALTQVPSTQETNKTLDLMQLVLNDNPLEINTTMHPHLTIQEISEELTTTLESYFSATLLQHLNIVPFLPLDYSAFEKIIRLKVKLFTKRLETNFGIELNCAPEIIKFLAHEALWRKPQTKPLDKLLEHHLYSAVATEILAYAEDKNRPKRLLLRLNDDGQVLRCEFISAAGSAVYTVS